MVEIKEIPIDESNNENTTSDSNSNNIIKTQKEYEERTKLVSASVYRKLSIVIFVLSLIVLPLIILSYFYNTGQPDKTALVIEQIVGFVLFGLGLIVALALFSHSRKLKTEKDYVSEQIIQNTNEEKEEN